jgi:hypothetical protein
MVMGARLDRLHDRIGASDERFVDLLNQRFDAVMIALAAPEPPEGVTARHRHPPST